MGAAAVLAAAVGGLAGGVVAVHGGRGAGRGAPAHEVARIVPPATPARPGAAPAGHGAAPAGHGAAPADPGAASTGAGAPEPVSTVLAFADRQVRGVPARLGSWRLAGRSEVLGPWSDQGLATVAGQPAAGQPAAGQPAADRPAAAGSGAGAGRIVYRGTLSVDGSLTAQGWDHVGDPDSWAGWVVDPFQGGPGATAKMFRLTAPGGGPVTEAVHPLVAGEAANNSFAAVTPDGRWTVSGEWGDEARLLVFPGPAALAPVGGRVPLPLAGVVRLDRTVRDVQGCAFASAVTLVCATSDPGSDLWPVPDQVLRIDLTGSPAAAKGRVSLIGQVPMTGACPGTYEPEGVDVDRATGELRLVVAPPPQCALWTQVYDYRSA